MTPVTNIEISNFNCFSAMDSELLQACRRNDDYGIEYSIYRGADIFAINENGITALEIIDPTKKNYVACLRPIISGVSKLIFEGEKFPENLKNTIVMNACFNQILEECINVLKKMKRITFFENLNYYSILKMPENKVEIAALFDNEEFEEGFEKIWKFKSKNYERQLWRIYHDCNEIYLKFKVLF